MDADRIAKELAQARREIADLHRRLELVEAIEVGPPIPHTMLLDESFLKRSFAVYGHYLVATVITGVPIFLLLYLFGA